ncbi:hypothetical protein LCGC14_1319320, partial [marine sediment metagenome]
MAEKYNPFYETKAAKIPLRVVEREDLSLLAKIVYGLLARYAGKDGECYPGQTLLAFHVKKSVRMVRRAMDQLREKGEIKIEMRPGKRSMVTFLTPDKTDRTTPVISFPTTPDNSDNDPGHSVPLTPDSSDPLHIKERKQSKKTLKEGGADAPTPPADDAPPHVVLAFKFYTGRVERGDQHFHPYEPKQLSICARIIREKAGGDASQAFIRQNWLYRLSQREKFYQFTPGHLLSKWEDLFAPVRGELQHETRPDPEEPKPPGPECHTCGRELAPLLDHAIHAEDRTP